MRLLLLIFFCLPFLSLKSQTPYAPGIMNFQQAAAVNQYRVLPDSNSLAKKWSLNKYAGLSAGFLFSTGAPVSILSAPIGLQLTRRLNNNLYAFTGISVAPTYFHFSPAFSTPAFNKNYPGTSPMGINQFGMSSRAELGLLYVNDQRTFSISGSIGVGRNNYPAYGYNNFPVQQPMVVPSRH